MARDIARRRVVYRSAGSSTRATVTELGGVGAQTVVVGALMLLGDRGERYFAERSIPVVAPTRPDKDCSCGSQTSALCAGQGLPWKGVNSRPRVTINFGL